MNKHFDYQKKEKSLNQESKSEQSRFNGNYPTFKNGYFNAQPKRVPYGFNWILGYCQETEDMALSRCN